VADSQNHLHRQSAAQFPGRAMPQQRRTIEALAAMTILFVEAAPFRIYLQKFDKSVSANSLGMSEVKIFWDPNGFELSSLGDRNYLKTTDGDTPSVSVPIRMLSIDAPELHYPDNKPPSSQDKNLAQLAV
jgi:endonuclease YncB( thermonuclease family)